MWPFHCVNTPIFQTRAIALDPDLIMFDEPFVGQDPITMGVLVELIKDLNQALGLTSIVVSHDVPEVMSIADWVYLLADGALCRFVFLRKVSKRIYLMVASFIQFVASLGRRTLAICEAFGRATLMLVGAIFSKPQPSKSFPLLIKQLYSVHRHGS